VTIQLPRSVRAGAMLLVWLATAAGAQRAPLLGLVLPLARSADRPAYRAGELVVQFRDTTSRERALGVAATTGSDVVYSARHVPGLYVVTVPRGMTLPQAISAYRQRLDVQYAEPNYLDHPFFVPDDPRFGEQWHLAKIGCPAAWDTIRGRKRVVVALIDTGVAFKSVAGHPQAPDLAGTTFVAPWDAVDGDSEPVDDENHGTHVCGTIAQTTNNGLGVAGVAPLCSIMPIRSLGPGGGTHVQFSEACHYAADNGAQIINYSAGGADSDTKQAAVQYAYGKGVLICAAMGNDGVLNSGQAYPARYPEVIGVAASTLNNQQAYYSNYGPDVELTGPGGDTRVDVDGNGYPDGVVQNTFAAGLPDGGFDYYYMMGTSMATPHVTGAAALVYAEILRRGETPARDQVRTILQETAQDLGDPGKDQYFGYGLVRADLALAAVDASIPAVDWVGSPGFDSDGVDPDKAAPDSLFRFRVRYTDAEGDEPVTALLWVQKRTCDGWKTFRKKTLAPMYGQVATGKVYGASARLPNAVYRYRFAMASASGAATGAPSEWTLGPMVVGTPFLCWEGSAGFVSDGVKPNSGAVGTRFEFRVLYRDSRGNSPTVRNLRIRRNGALYRTLAMTPDGGLLRTGKAFSTRVTLSKTGDYEYRFDFADVSGPATGPPTKWKAGPTLEAATTTALVTSASAVQTHQGSVQIVFTLSADAAVTARVLNIAGREVRTLARARRCGSGLNSLLWDSRTNAGLMAPAGTYLVYVQALGGDGAENRAMAVLTLRR
jgi:serine protease